MAIAVAMPATGAGKKAYVADASHIDSIGTSVQITFDGLQTDFNSLPQYKSSKPRSDSTDMDLAFLDDIADSMTVEASLDYALRHSHHNQNRSDSYNHKTRNYDTRYEMRPSLSLRDFFRPVPGYITSYYGWREQFHRMHYGVDLHLNIGDTVRAAISGTVERIGYDPDGYGCYMVMSHADNMETIYGHLLYAVAEEGDVLLSGDAIGIGGNTGNSTGPHLHFEAKIDGESVDPLTIFDFYGINAFYAYEYGHEAPDPDESPAASKKSLGNKRTYVVRYGDTPKSIARRAGISLSELCRLNMIKTTDKLQVGRMVKLK